MDDLISKLEHMASPGFANLSPEWKAVAREAAAALEAAREDADRWRCLRREVFHGDIPVGEARLILEVTGSCPSREELDAAIDQARGKGGCGEGVA